MSFIKKLGSMIGSKAKPTATKASRSVAKERLSVILASQRGSELMAGVDMDALQKDVLEVVKRHIEVSKNSPINCQVKNDGEVNLFEMSVEINNPSSGGSSRQNSVTIQAST